jgi:hypothetical protein
LTQRAASADVIKVNVLVTDVDEFTRECLAMLVGRAYTALPTDIHKLRRIRTREKLRQWTL